MRSAGTVAGQPWGDTGLVAPAPHAASMFKSLRMTMGKDQERIFDMENYGM